MIIKHEKNISAVNEIFGTMTDDEKIFSAGEAGDTEIPKEYASPKDYENSPVESVIVYEGDIPISYCDIWVKDSIGEICVGTRRGFRRNGYASAVLAEAIEVFRADVRLAKLRYYLHQGNVGSLNLARKFGFVEFGNNEYYIGLELCK